MQSGPGLSRRKLLGSTAAVLTGLPAAAGIAPAAGQEKIKQADAKYRPSPNFGGAQRCEICLQFEAPNHCKIVAGQISPKGWCQYFAARENAR